MAAYLLNHRGGSRCEKTQVRRAWQVTVGVAGRQLTALTGGFLHWARLLGTTWEHLLLGKVLWRECEEESENIQRGFEEKVALQLQFGATPGKEEMGGVDRGIGGSV